MEQEAITQTAFDQLVCSEEGQMLKAMIPYMSLKGQQILSAYTKIQELQNTMTVFSRAHRQEMQICSAAASDPIEILEDVRKFCYGQTRKQLDQLSNMLVMIQLMQTMNE